MKPALKWSDIFGRDLWLEQFNRLKDLPAGTKLYRGTEEFEIVHVWDEPHPKRLELSFREGHAVKPYQCRRGDSLIFELQTEPVEVIT